MPSGGGVVAAARSTAETQRRRGGGARGGRGVGRRHPGLAAGAAREIRRKDPMPSGAVRPHRRDERIHGATERGAGAAQGDHLGRIEAVLQARASAAGAPLGGTRPGAQAAMHPATVVLHRRLAAAAAGAGMGAAARGGQEIAGLCAVAQAAAAIGRQAGGRGPGRRGVPKRTSRRRAQSMPRNAADRGGSHHWRPQKCVFRLANVL